MMFFWTGFFKHLLRSKGGGWWVTLENTAHLKGHT